MVEDKIIKSFVLEPTVFQESEIEDYLKSICNEIDEPTPILLNKHFTHLQQFSNTTFTNNDFVETIYFDKMVVEIFDDKDKKNKTLK